MLAQCAAGGIPDNLGAPPLTTDSRSLGRKANGFNDTYGRGGGDRKQYRMEFQGLTKILGNAKPLKRNNRECKGILIGPSMALVFRVTEVRFPFTRVVESRLRIQIFAARMASRHSNLQTSE
jgi:hypothetical protein